MVNQQRHGGLVDPAGLLAGLLEGRYGDPRVGLLGGLLAGLLADLEHHTFVDAVRGCAAFGMGHTRRRLRPFSERHGHRKCKREQSRQLTRSGEGRKAQPGLEVEGQACNSVTLSSLDCLLSV